MLGVLILLAAAPLNAATPLLDEKSARPPAEFGSCFTQAQEHDGRPWAYLPSEHGGTFTDSGAHGAAASYWLQVRGTGASTEVRLFGAAVEARAAKVIEAVNQCQ